jgi:hypothetical protein
MTRKPDAMHDRLARREQRRAARLASTDTARRLARVELDLDCLHAATALDSILRPGPEPGVITPAVRQSDEAALKAMEPLIWNLAERLALDAMTTEDGPR